MATRNHPHRLKQALQRPRKELAAVIGTHGILLLYTAFALGPIILIVMNSVKSQNAIFSQPLAWPTADTFSLEGYETVFDRGHFATYFTNSTIVTVVSMALIVAFSAMAAFALTEYDVPFFGLLLGFFALGIMIPIRLGTVSILKLMVSFGLVNSLTALVLVYVAMGLPLGIIIMAQFMRQTPGELKDAARVDGAGELRVFRMILPLVGPGLAATAVVSMLPVWNDLWFPLVLAPSDETATVTLGVTQFVGQFVVDWSAVLSALTIGAIPLIILFVIFSRQFISGLTAGIGKQ